MGNYSAYIDGSKLLSLELMNTREAQMKGLQFSEGLSDSNGLLFPTRGGQGYHMNNVPFDIDICFTDEAGKILEITRMASGWGGASAPPQSKWAIETNQGFWRRENLGAGDILTIIPEV